MNHLEPERFLKGERITMPKGDLKTANMKNRVIRFNRELRCLDKVVCPQFLENPEDCHDIYCEDCPARDAEYIVSLAPREDDGRTVSCEEHNGKYITSLEAQVRVLEHVIQILRDALSNLKAP